MPEFIVKRRNHFDNYITLNGKHYLICFPEKLRLKDIYEELYIHNLEGCLINADVEEEGIWIPLNDTFYTERVKYGSVKIIKGSWENDK